MTKILGLDLGTNSIGWAITEQDNDHFTLIDRGVDIFQEGVNRTKSGEAEYVFTHAFDWSTTPEGREFWQKIDKEWNALTRE